MHLGVVAGGEEGGPAAEKETGNTTPNGTREVKCEQQDVNRGEREVAQKPLVGPNFKGHGRGGDRSGVTGTAPSPG